MEDYVKSEGCNLIVMGGYLYSWFCEMVLGGMICYMFCDMQFMFFLLY